MQISENQELILGCPGTGKTTTVLNEIDTLFNKGVPPDRVAFVSFTRKAVHEGVDRACTKFNLSKHKFPLFKTIHAMCFAGLGISKKDMMGRENYRELGEWLGYRFEGTWDEAEGIPVGSEKGDTLLFLDNLARITKRPLREVWEENYALCAWDELERFQDCYQEYKSGQFLMDFTDMLYAYVAMCDPSRAEYAFIDEAQDLSAAQWDVLKHAFGGVRKTVISGDDDQAIFKWSGADVSMFLKLTGTKRVLGQSYRLPKAVYRFATGITAKIQNRFEKEFLPRQADGEIEFFNFLEHVNIDPEERTLFLARNQYLLDNVEKRLEEAGIPYIGKHGYSSIRKSHIVSIHAVEKLRKGEPITGAEAKEMYEHMRVGYYLKYGFKTKIQTLTDSKLYSYTDLNQEWGLNDLAVWYSMLQGINDSILGYYRAVLGNGYSLTGTPNCSISTIHGAKGGEAEHVVVLSDMAQKSYREYERNPDDERRVAYVAATRAKEKLSIVQPSTKMYYPYYLEGDIGEN